MVLAIGTMDVRLELDAYNKLKSKILQQKVVEMWQLDYATAFSYKMEIIDLTTENDW